MIVVSNTSPITSLAAIGHIDLLHRLYTSVLIPQAVFDELTGLPDQPGGVEVQSLPWFSTGRALDQALVNSLLDSLDQGEAEAIALALESAADLLLIDDRMGRHVAERFGLRLTGTLGVLVEAKRLSHIPAVRPVMEDLVQKGRFRISPALYRVVLATAGET